MKLTAALYILTAARVFPPLDILRSRVGFQPQPGTGKQASGSVERLNRLSDQLDTHLQIRDARYVVPF